MRHNEYGLDQYILQNPKRNKILNKLKSQTGINVKKEIYNYRKNKLFLEKLRD